MKKGRKKVGGGRKKKGDNCYSSVVSSSFHRYAPYRGSRIHAIVMRTHVLLHNSITRRAAKKTPKREGNSYCLLIAVFYLFFVP